MSRKIIVGAFMLFAIGIIAVLLMKIDTLSEENNVVKRNQEILIAQKDAEIESYKVLDSLNAAKASQLQISLAEYKKYNAKNLQAINALKIERSNLENIISAQLNTIDNISVSLNDSVGVIAEDSLKCFAYNSNWCDISGCIDLKQDSAHLQIVNREAIKIIETVIYKRFLGFLWRTNKVKDRQVDVVSDNPHTIIVGLDYVRIVP